MCKCRDRAQSRLWIIRGGRVTPECSSCFCFLILHHVTCLCQSRGINIRSGSYGGRHDFFTVVNVMSTAAKGIGWTASLCVGDHVCWVWSKWASLWDTHLITALCRTSAVEGTIHPLPPDVFFLIANILCSYLLFLPWILDVVSNLLYHKAACSNFAEFGILQVSCLQLLPNGPNFTALQFSYFNSISDALCINLHNNWRTVRF